MSGYKNQKLTTKFSSQTKQQLQAAAARQDAPVSHVIRTAVKQYLQNQPTQY